MLGHRGCRLGVTFPAIYEMQVRAIFEAAVHCLRARVRVLPEVMIPLVGTVEEFRMLAARVRAVYSAKPLTVDAIAAAIGDTPAGADAAFASWVRSRTAAVDPKLRFEGASVDVDRLLAAGKTAEALASVDRALALKPGDSIALLTRSTALAAVDRDAEAEAILRDLLKLPEEGPTLRFVVHAHYQLALLLDDTKRYDEARKHYDAILALPDVEGSHRAANEALGNAGP